MAAASAATGSPASCLAVGCLSVGRRRAGLGRARFSGPVLLLRPRAGPAEWRNAWLAHKHACHTDVLGGERQQRELSSSLERDVQRPLVRGARARLATWLDLAALRQEPPQPDQVLVVDLFDLVDAELTHLASRSEFAAAAPAKFTRASTSRRGASAWAAGRRGRGRRSRRRGCGWGSHGHVSRVPFSGWQPHATAGAERSAEYSVAFSKRLRRAGPQDRRDRPGLHRRVASRSGQARLSRTRPRLARTLRRAADCPER